MPANAHIGGVCDSGFDWRNAVNRLYTLDNKLIACQSFQIGMGESHTLEESYRNCEFGS